jgi:hypothetical protein
MNFLTIIALVVATVIILAPAALIWYINIGGMVKALREAKAKRTAETVRKATVKAQ